MPAQARTLSLLATLALFACNDEVAEPEPSSTEHDYALSAFAGCGPDDGPILVLIEDQTCTVTFAPDEGLYVWVDLRDGGELFEVGDDSFEACQQCSDGVCEDALSCEVELLDSAETELRVRVDASFPSGPLSRELSAYLCVSGCAW